LIILSEAGTDKEGMRLNEFTLDMMNLIEQNCHENKILGYSYFNCASISDLLYGSDNNVPEKTKSCPTP